MSDSPTITKADNPRAELPRWISFDQLVAEVSAHFSPPLSKRTLRRSLRRAGIPECRPSTPSNYGSQATLYFDREQATRWLHGFLNPTEAR